MNAKTKKWLVSSGVTFLTGFLVVITPMLDDINANTLTWATISGIGFAGLRGGVKYFTEFLIDYFNK